MSSADLLRQLAQPAVAAALTDGANALDQVTKDQATIAGLQTSLTAAAALHAADVAQHAADVQKIADLEAQLHPTPPPPAGPAWGNNIGTNTGKLTQVDTKMGGIDAVRFYFSAGQGIHFPTAAEFGGDLGKRIAVISAKLLPQDVLAGKYDAQIKATAQACPTDRYTLLCDWHEPGSEVYSTKTFTAQQYRDAQTRFAQIVHSVGNPKVLVALIVEGYTWNGHAGRDWHDLYAGAGAADVFCTDEYAWSPTDPGNLDAMFAGGAAAAKEAGKPYCVTETGVENTTFTGQARYDALTKVAKRVHAVTTGPVALYFGADPTLTGNRWDITTDPRALAAWKAGQTG